MPLPAQFNDLRPSRLPNCRRCLEVRHIEVEMRLDREATNEKAGSFWSFYCPRCNFLWAVSKPQSREAHQALARLQRREQLLRAQREHERRPRYLDLGGSLARR